MGFLAKSKAGHDKGDIYFIIRSDEEYAFLADGVLKKIDSPKKKNLKHIQIIKKDLLNDTQLTDEVIKKCIKDYKKSIE